MKTNFWVALVLLLGACGEPPKNYVLQVNLQKLTTEQIYNRELIYDVIFDAEELDIDSLRNQSRQLFLHGIEALKNQRKPKEAARLFKESIMVFPDAKTYYELGNALLQLPNAHTEAIKAYEVAEYLQFQPIANIYYNKALAQTYSNNKSNNWEITHNLLMAIRNGYADTAQLYNEPNFRTYVQSDNFKSYLISLKAEQLREKPDALFDLYLKSFSTVKQPFEISQEKADMKNYTRSISYDFQRFVPEMQNTSFGCEVSHDFFYVAKVGQTAQYTALLYSSVSFFDEEMQPVMTRLATYDNKGKQISSLVFSCQCSAEKVKAGHIENNLITLQDYKRIWKYPIDQRSFEENSVEKYELLATATYKITSTGKIEVESVPEGYSDTNLIAAKQD